MGESLEEVKEALSCADGAAHLPSWNRAMARQMMIAGSCRGVGGQPVNRAMALRMMIG